MIDRIQLKPTSIEREIFPNMADEGQLYQMSDDGFWMDIGQPKDYLTGQKLYLEHLQKHNDESLSKGQNIIGEVMIHPSAQVDPTSVLGPNVVVGANCKIGPGCKIYNSTIMSNSTL